MSVQTDKVSSPSNIQKLQLSEKLKSHAQTLTTDRQKVIRSKINMLKKSSPVQENINIVNDEREREERMLSGSPRGSLDDKTCSRFVSPVRSPEESPDSFHSASSSHVSPLLTLNTTPTHLSGKNDRGVNTDMFTNKSSYKKQSRGQMKRRDSLQGLVR